MLTFGGLAVGLVLITVLWILVRRRVITLSRLPLLLGVGGILYSSLIFATAIVLFPGLFASISELLWAIPIGVAAYFAGLIIVKASVQQ